MKSKHWGGADSCIMLCYISYFWRLLSFSLWIPNAWNVHLQLCARCIRCVAQVFCRQSWWWTNLWKTARCRCHPSLTRQPLPGFPCLNPFMLYGVVMCHNMRKTIVFISNMIMYLPVYWRCLMKFPFEHALCSGKTAYGCLEEMFYICFFC